MRSKFFIVVAVALGFSRAACTSHSSTPDGGDAADGGDARAESGNVPCQDFDMDGIVDNLEHSASASITGDADDEDGDGFNDAIEANRGYPMFGAPQPTLRCGQAPDDCDGDGLPNFHDLDSDNDGLTDAEERTHATNPCVADTDGDMVDDLTEVIAMSDPRDAHSVPPAGSLYVALPYHAPGESAPPAHREFTFNSRIRQADVFFLVDNSASMMPIITELRATLSNTIVPGIRRAIPDIRTGIGSFDSMPDGIDGDQGHPGDYTLWIRQRVSDDTTLSQHALDVMHTVDTDTGSAGFAGGDTPECQTEAIFELIQGDGTPGYETDPAAIVSIHNALDTNANGWVPRWDATRDCAPAPSDPVPFGFGCFATGRVPIIVLASDSPWYNGGETGSPQDPNSHTFVELASAMQNHGALFIGVDVGLGDGGDTFQNSQALATACGTLDAAGQPIVFGPGSTGITSAADGIVSAIATIASQSRHDLTTRVDADGSETRLAAGHTTRDFVRTVTPARAMPDAPVGFDRMDATTFYGVVPSTQVVFGLDLFNDFQPAGAVALLFRASIAVVGRAATEVDRRDVFIIVPARGSQPPG